MKECDVKELKLATKKGLDPVDVLVVAQRQVLMDMLVVAQQNTVESPRSCSL